RVLNATAVGVAFWLPLLGSTSACAPRVAHGVEFADVGNGKLSQALLDPGEELLRFHWAFWRFGEVFDALSTRGRCEEWGKRRSMRGLCVLHEDPEMVPGLGFSPEKATDPAVVTSALPSLVVRRLFRNASSVGIPRFCVSQARECARGLSRYSGTVEVLSSSWTPSLSGRVVVRLRKRRQ
ncbi:hypothetical protein Taro_003766, partial [Colocasia esculenta]|nr:hypothetical protein [Colocasia esculenta]